ncbi:G/U mismatch-specific DNA glycosylase [Cellulosimicrobium funkei]|uniref:G/U mismatch-specific DNA glycosylase n=1 Tax=Cellulosimicrobium funkei TaxID=264251 RepID=UPI00088F1B09|nr:G/U mismatch-specific uracil-DNA glycosylase [Cellulosimicrobium cellulans]
MPTDPPYARPTADDLAAARGREIEDWLRPDLDVLFCGINPGLYSAAVGLPFANPGTRYWKAMHEAGFTERVLGPWERVEFLDAGLGMTNVVRRATARAGELTPEEIVAGGHRLGETAETYRPRWVAVLGLGAYRTAFADRGAAAGPQERRLGPARVWLLPNPSGLNAHDTVATLGAAYAELRVAAGLPDRRRT